MNTSTASKATAVALSGGKVQFNDTQSDKPWYTGQLAKVKRGDWVQWMVQYVTTGKVLPVFTYLSGIVQQVSGNALQVYVACVPPEQTQISYADSVSVTLDQVLEHTPHDTEKSEFFMAREVVAQPKHRLGAGMWDPSQVVTVGAEN